MTRNRATTRTRRTRLAKCINFQRSQCRTGGFQELSAPRGAFTLVELLVSISILLILSVMTFSAFSVTANEDRIRAAARQVQSTLEGARDRAIYAKEPRGVRFILDPQDTSTVSSMIYIGAPQRLSGTLYIYTDSTVTNPTYRVVTQSTSGRSWGDLAVRNLLRAGARIQIPAKTGLWYSIEAFETDSDVDGTVDSSEDTLLDNDLWDIRLTQALADRPVGETTYLLEVQPAVLPNQEPVTLPAGIVLDLDFSKLPSSWFEVNPNASPPPWNIPFLFGTNQQSNPTEMDILFSPRGGVTGTIASQGIIHFLLADIADTTRNLPAVDFDGSIDTNGDGTVDSSDQNSTIDEEETSEGDRRVITIFTRTGHIAVSPVYQNASDPFRYAETGEEVD